MRRLMRWLLVWMMVLSQSCATQALWKNTDPQERIWIDATKVTEESLRSRGVAFEAFESPKGKGFLIEKSGWRKMGDYHLRALGTPVTLVLDTATTVVVVGFYLLLVEPEGTVSLIQTLAE